MRGVNEVTIIGLLGADPDVKQFNNGGSIANISVATTEQWTDKQSGEKKEATEWHRITLANRLGEIAAQYLRKGSKVYIKGALKTRKYQDTQGQDRYVTEIRALAMQMLDSANEGQKPNNNQGYQNNNNQQSNQQNQFNNQNSQAPSNQNNRAPTPMPQSVDDMPVDEDIPF